MAGSGSLLVDSPRPGVVWLTLNDPARRNPLSSALFAELTASLRALPPDTRAVVLTGAGEESFASGADFAELTRPGAGGMGGEFGRAMEDALYAIEAVPAPVVARIQGHCLGAGYQLALACDLRVAVDTARIGVPASRFGLLPGPVHHRRMLQQLGVQVTRELMFTARGFAGEEARRRGLVDHSCHRDELDATVQAIVDDISRGAPLTVRNSKRMINRLLAMEARGEPLDDASRAEMEALSQEAHASDDVREGLAAFFERRDPEFQGR